MLKNRSAFLEGENIDLFLTVTNCYMVFFDVEKSYYVFPQVHHMVFLEEEKSYTHFLKVLFPSLYSFQVKNSKISIEHIIY